MTGPAAFRLRTLGTLRLERTDGRDDPALAIPRRKLALLVLLAVSGRPVSRDRLVDLFWGDHPEERARHSLSDALSHLRRILGPEAITSRQAEVGLAEGVPLTVDLRELAEAARVEDWHQVVSLFDGPFLDGVYVGGSSDWEHWVGAQRTGSMRLFERACLAEAQRCEGSAAWDALEALTARWLAVQPDDATALAFHRTAQRHLDAMRPAPEAGGVSTTPVTASTSSPPGAPRMRTPWYRHRRVVGAAIAALLLIAVAASASRWRAQRDATFQFTTRSPEARALVERASLGSDGGVSRTEAISLLEQAIALDSGFAMAYRTLALLHAGDGTRQAEVATLLTRAAGVAYAVSPFERALVMSSYHMMVTGDFARAAAAQRNLIRLAPDDGDAWHDLGMTYQYLGDDARAAEVYREALARDATSGSTWANLLDALVATGDRPAIEAALDSMARAIPGHPWIFLATSRVRAAQGDLTRAEAAIRSYLAATPDAPRRQGIGEMMLARILWRAGALDEGDAAAQRGIAWQLRLGDTVAALRESLADAAVRIWARGDRTGATRRLDAAVARYPLTSVALEDRLLPERAMVQALVGRTDEAQRTLDTYLSLVPEPVRRRNRAAVESARATLDLVRGDLAAARASHTRYLGSPTTLRADLLDALYVEWIAARLGRDTAPLTRETIARLPSVPRGASRSPVDAGARP